jgi:hypothetical protein
MATRVGTAQSVKRMNYGLEDRGSGVEFLFFTESTTILEPFSVVVRSSSSE